MKNCRIKSLLVFALLILNGLSVQVECQVVEKDENGHLYRIYPEDPYQMRNYTLPNGLQVYLVKNTKAPRIRSSIMVKAGSKQDRADATGLAHYLEHLLFKGTDHIGSLDFEKRSLCWIK